MHRKIFWDTFRIPATIGNLRYSYLANLTVRLRDADAAIDRHTRWDWGPVDGPQQRENDRNAIWNRRAVHSVYALSDGRQLHVVTCYCRCGRFPGRGPVTLLLLADELLYDPCECIRP